MWPHLLGALLFACSGAGGKDTACPEAALYVDADGDGFGVGESTTVCAGSEGYAAASGDCDDTDASVHPGAAEACNGHDDDCDGVVDPPDQTWYLDQDGDGYAGEATVTDCAQPEDGYAEPTDCDDANWTVYPGADDSWYDGVDSDCGGEDDYDADGDGFASEEHSEAGTDCDDDSNDIHPEAEEVCEDGVDQDCTGWDAACGPYGDHDVTDADMVLVGPEEEYLLGAGLHGGGDTNGDGRDELWVGAVGLGGGDLGVGVAFGFADVNEGVWGPDRYAISSVEGLSEDDNLGYGLEAGDVDGDGYDELFVSALGRDSGHIGDAGAVYMLSGPPSEAFANLTEPAAEWVGENANSWFGYRLQLLDPGTAAPSVAIDAPYHDLSDEYQSTGAIFFFPATPGDPLTEDDAVARLQCLTNGCAFGGFGFDAGDTNGDGIDDLVTNAVYESETGLGMRVATALLFEGPFESGDLRTVADADSAWSHGDADRLGWDLDLVDDLDGDGLPDLVLGAFWAESGDDWLGKVEVLHSPLEGWGEPDPAASFWGDEDGAAFGRTVEAESDLDGDGARDLLVGIPWRGLANDSEPITGEGCLFYGPFEGTREADEADACWLGQNDDDFLAETMASGFDLDGDGFDDVALGSWHWPSYDRNGAVYVIRGGPQE